MADENVVLLSGFDAIPLEKATVVESVNVKEDAKYCSTADDSIENKTATIQVWNHGKDYYYTLLTLPDGKCLRFYYDVSSNIGTDSIDVQRIALFFGYTYEMKDPVDFSIETQRELIDKKLITIL